MEKIDFGKKLINLRKVRGLTQEEVAEKCNITTRTIQRIESGTVKPRSSTIKIISKTLGVDFYEISNQNSELKNHTILWYFKDLFNLKTNVMKKISILTASIVLIVFASINAFNLKAQSNSSNNEEKAELITKNEKDVLSNKYDLIGEFGEIGKDWAVVKKDNKYGCIDTNYKVVVPVEYDLIGEFGEIGKDWAVVKKDNKYGCIDTNGKIVVPVQYHLIGEFGEIGEDWAAVKQINKYGCIDTNGKIVVPVEYDLIGEFGEIGKDWAVVKKINKYGCIDTNGKIVVPVEYDLIGEFGEIGKYWAMLKKDNKYGLMNLDGKVAIPCEYENIQINGAIAIVTKNGKKERIHI